MFCAIEHPAGVSQGMDGRVRLRHFPGIKLAPGETLTSKVSIVGVAAKGGARKQFVDYIRAHSPRKRHSGNLRFIGNQHRIPRRSKLGFE